MYQCLPGKRQQKRYQNNVHLKTSTITFKWCYMCNRSIVFFRSSIFWTWYTIIEGGGIITIFRGQVDFGHFLGADSENHTHFGWKLILSLLPYAPSWPEYPKNGQFCMALQMVFNSEFEGKISFYCIKTVSIWPLATWLASGRFWGLVLVWTRLAKILKIHKIDMYHFLPILPAFWQWNSSWNTKKHSTA